MFNEGSFMQMGERQQPVGNFKQAFEWMMKEIKKASISSVTKVWAK
jgi:hypothetical protein